MFFRDGLVAAFLVHQLLRLALELFTKRFVVEEGPRIVEFVVPTLLQLFYGRKQVIQLAVSYQGQNGSVDAWGVGIIGGVVICSPQRFWRLTNLFNMMLSAR